MSGIQLDSFKIIGGKLIKGKPTGLRSIWEIPTDVDFEYLPKTKTQLASSPVTYFGYPFQLKNCSTLISQLHARKDEKF